MKKYIMALDSGTTSNRCILFNKKGEICSVAQKEFTQIFPRPGWVEHDAEEIFDTVLYVARQALANIGATAEDIAAIGITNQRETTIVWNRHTGQPICNAIVWQCRRTAGFCQELQAEGLTETIRQKTGLVIDPYFSGTKIRWILKNVPGAMEQAQHLHDGLHQVALVELLQQVRDDLGVGVGDEGVAIRLKATAQFGVVVDDAIVDDGEPSLLVEVWVRVADSGCAMGGPAGMGDAGRAVKPLLLGAGRLQIGDLPQRLDRPQLMVRAQGQPCRIVAAILQTAKAVQQDVLRRLAARVTYYSTHIVVSRKNSID